MKPILKSMALFLLGATVGAAGVWLTYGDLMRKSMAMMEDAHTSALYNYEKQEADLQFLNENHDVAIYALERATRNLNLLPASSRITCRRTAYTLGKYHVRLATLYGDLGKLQARDEHWQKALGSYAVMGWKLRNTQELEMAVPDITADKTADAMKKYGTLILPCDSQPSS